MTSRPRVNVVVTCTDKKTKRQAAELSVRDLPDASAEMRFHCWRRRLEDHNEGAIAAADLYSGNHWHVVRGLPQAAETLDVNLWVASAGYGLVPISAPLIPYAATFSRGPDSVGTLKDARQWWDLLSGWEGPTPGSPRSLTQLAEREPDVPLLIAASAIYSQVLTPDIRRASQAAGKSTRIAVFSAGLRPYSEIANLVVPSDARYKQIVRGQMHSLNARLVRHALLQSAKWLPDTDALRRLFAIELGALPRAQAFDRMPMTDEQLLQCIGEQLKSQPRAGHTTLLRQLRVSGKACEQGRFKRLFEQAKSTPHT